MTMARASQSPLRPKAAASGGTKSSPCHVTLVGESLDPGLDLPGALRGVADRERGGQRRGKPVQARDRLPVHHAVKPQPCVDPERARLRVRGEDPVLPLGDGQLVRSFPVAPGERNRTTGKGRCPALAPVGRPGQEELAHGTGRAAGRAVDREGIQARDDRLAVLVVHPFIGMGQEGAPGGVLPGEEQRIAFAAAGSQLEGDVGDDRIPSLVREARALAHRVQPVQAVRGQRVRRGKAPGLVQDDVQAHGFARIEEREPCLPVSPVRDETRGQIDGDVGAQVAHLRPDRNTGDNGKRQKEDPAGRNAFHPHLHIIGCWCPLD